MAIHMRDPFVFVLPEERRYLLFGTTDPDPWAGPGTGFDVYGEIHAMPLSRDLRVSAGDPTLLFRASEAPWSRPFDKPGRPGNCVTDGPFLHRMDNGSLRMLWSTLGGQGYAMGYAISESGRVLGPWRQSRQPLYGKDGGHGMRFRGLDGRLRVTLHRPNRTPHERPVWIEVAERDRDLVFFSCP